MYLKSHGLAFERGTVLRAFVLALHRYIDFAKEKNVDGCWDFASIVYTLISSRRNVCSEAMDRFPDFFSVTVNVVQNELNAYLSIIPENDVLKGKAAVHITPCDRGKGSDNAKGGGSDRQVALPAALLCAACVILSNWKGQGENVAAHKRSEDAIFDLMNMLLRRHDSDEDTNSESVGLAGATFVETGNKAVTVDQVGITIIIEAENSFLYMCRFLANCFCR